MKPEDASLPVRKNPRIPNYDYSTPGYYFITICTKDKQCIFGSPGQPNPLGCIAEQCFSEMQSHFPGVSVDKFVVMPNHVHGMIVLHHGHAKLTAVIGQYKSAVSKKIHAIAPDVQVWQTSFHDHIVRNERDYQRILRYIDGNPLRWKEDCFYTE